MHYGASYSGGFAVAEDRGILPSGGASGDVLAINASGNPEWSSGYAIGRVRIAAPFVSMSDPRGNVDDWLYDGAVDPDHVYVKDSVSPHHWLVYTVGTVAP